jgi:integrase
VTDLHPIHQVPLATVSPESKRSIDKALADLHSPNTRRAYDHHWKMFEHYCRANNYRTVPADVDVVCEYLQVLESTIIDRPNGTRQIGYSISYLELAVKAIKFVHRKAVAVPEPVLGEPPQPVLWQHPQLADYLTAARNRNARTERVTEEPAEPILLEPLTTMIIDTQSRADTWVKHLHARRDSAALLISFTGALRRSEAVALRPCDVKAGHNGRWTIRIPRSKTDQSGKGTVKALPRGARIATCPQCALLRWMECVTVYETAGRSGLIRLLSRDTPPTTHICRQLPTYGHPRKPIFRSIVRGEIKQSAVTGDTLHNMIRRRLAASFPELDATKYGWHSLRAGFVTQSKLNGIDDHAIMRQTGHKDPRTLQRYAREQSTYDNNAATGLGL